MESVGWHLIVLVGFVIGFAVLGAVAYAIGGCLYWVLGPLERAAKGRRFTMQFSLADLFCLFVLVQLSLGAVHWAARANREPPMHMLVFDLIVAAVVVVVWWACLATLSPAGIDAVWHRCFVLCVALPLGLVGSFGIIVLPFAAFILLKEAHNPVGYWLFLAEPLDGCVLYGLGRFTRVIVASAEARRSESPPAPE
jgi:hypothetical protein